MFNLKLRAKIVAQAKKQYFITGNKITNITNITRVDKNSCNCNIHFACGTKANTTIIKHKFLGFTVGYQIVFWYFNNQL